MITIAQETLIFRRQGISPCLRLLVPTFLLPNAPAWLTPLPSQLDWNTLLPPTLLSLITFYVYYNSNFEIFYSNSKTYTVKVRRALNFGNILNPDYLRRKIS